ncbi:GntP family permease [Pseudonocardiaceae bacterium YIM PH 21723]|nr:GntP family permease [Pseudonocardiaceae bacterium YIM PH 21723]
MEWLQHSTSGLLTLAAAGIALLLLMIMRWKVEPFIALLIIGVLTALASGRPITELVGDIQKSNSGSLIETGFGGILGHIAVIIGMGAFLGAILEASGGAQVLTRKLLQLFGENRAGLAMGLAGLIFGIPVFFDIGVFVLAPLVYTVARQSGRSVLFFCLPLLAGLSITHAMLPPHPGPVAAAGLLGVGLGWVILFGVICAIPAWAAALAFASWIGKRINLQVPDELIAAETTEDSEQNPPKLSTVVGIIAVPLLLILFGTFGSILLPKGSAAALAATFFGTPAIALTIAVLLAFWLLGYRRGMSKDEVSTLANNALRPVAMLLLVVGAGAFYGKVLTVSGIGKAVQGSLADLGLPILVAAYLISAGLRIAQGSATAAIAASAAIIGPAIATSGYSQPQLALIVAAICAGSIIASHVNDGGFWIVSRYFGISVKDTLRTWTVLETILSVVGFLVAAVLMIFV